MKINRKQLPIVLFVFLALFPLGRRAVRSLSKISVATKNIYEQQNQMGLFLREFYQRGSVAVNDIGAVNYFADIHCLDLWGIGNVDVLKAQRERTYGPEKMYEIAKAKNVKIAIIYDHWFSVPPQWIKVGEWRLRDNYVCGGDTVSFYAVDPLEKETLIENLKAFSPRLPKEVFQRVGGGELDNNV